MSTSGLSGAAAQSILGPLDIESSVPANTYVQRKRRKKKKRNENSVGESREMCHEPEKIRKRKPSQSLDEQVSEARSSLSENFDLRLGAPSFNSTQPLKAKRAKIIASSTIRAAKSASLLSDSWEADSGFSSEVSPPPSGRSSPSIGMNPSLLVAVDCEMVGTGPNGRFSELARCSILNYYGTVVYDKYILPRHPVTNYRTRWSGIKEEHMKWALSYEEARKEILHILRGKVIIGHALHNDFKALDITVPYVMTRDTCSMRLLRQLYGAPKERLSLKRLSSKLLNRSIQVGRSGHCSVEDALATLDLYKLVEEQWEKSLQTHIQNSDFIPEPSSSMEHYMDDQYWPESMMDEDQ